jgi:hypothetical protein
MQEKTWEITKKSGPGSEIRVSVTESVRYWIINARITGNGTAGSFLRDRGRTYFTGPHGGGRVLVLRDPFVSGTAREESWGPMETIDDFAQKALERILEDRAAAQEQHEEICGAGCG